MSGPKVVNLEAVRRRRQRESLVAIRQLRDAIDEWRISMRNAGLLTDSATAEAEAILARMESLRNGEQWDALFKELPSRRAFFRDGSAGAQQTSIDRLALLRERQRRLVLGIAMLKREFQLAGNPLPPELQGVSECTSDEANLSQIESLLQKLVSKLPAGNASTGATTAQQRELAGALKGDSGKTVSVENWLMTRAGENAAQRAKNDRLARALAELELQTPGESAAPLFAKAHSIATEPSAERRAMLTDSLLIEADELCSLVREQRNVRKQLLQAMSGLEPFQSAESSAWKQRLEGAIENPSQKAVSELVAAAQKWCAEEALREEAVLRREAVLKALAALGYEVREGMSTAWAENGRLIVRKPSDPNYGVELASAAVGPSLQARVVAFGNSERTAQAAQRDREIEVSWCADFQQMRTLLEAEGVTPTLVHATAAGEVPVKIVAPTEHEHRDLRSISSAPRARQTE